MLPLMRNTADPSLTLNFASGSLDSRISFSRASAGTYFDKTGTLQSAASGIPRFDWGASPGAAPLGLLLEPAATNSIRNNSNVGAVTGTPGTDPTNAFTFTALTGLTKTIVGFGTVNGQPYIDYQISGTASGAGTYSFYPESLAAIAATGDTWIYSASLAVVGGSQSNVTSIALDVTEYASGTFLAYTTTPQSVTGALTRFSTKRLLNQATTNQVSCQLDLNITAAGAVNITLRIAGQQLEKGTSGPTSLLLCAGTATSRAADIATIPTAGWFGANISSFAAEFTLGGLGSGNLAILGDAATLKKPIYVNSSGDAGTFDGVGLASTANALTAGTLAKVAATLNGANAQVILNAGTIAAAGGFSNGFSSIAAMGLMQDSTAGEQAAGWLRRVRAWRRVLTAAELVQVTT